MTAKRAVALIVLLVVSACGGSAETNALVTTTSAAPTLTQITAATTPTDFTEAATSPGDGTNIDAFLDGALAEDIVTVDCTLSDGAEISCYQITVAGIPADEVAGPFCPTTTSDTADEAGIWFDGENLYDIDGDFILDLPEIYDDDNWHLHDDEGHVHVTDTQEAFEAAARPDVAEEYQNHCVEGQIAWLDNSEPITSTVEIPVTPVASDSVTPAGDHLHGATGCSEVGDSSEGETPVFAIALDCYAIHSPLDAAYGADASLDQCNGHTTDEFGYHYHANNPEENAVLNCFTGEVSAGAGGPDSGPGEGGPGGPPDLIEAAEALGVTGAELEIALGPPPPDIAGAAATVGVDVEFLRELIGRP